MRACKTPPLIMSTNAAASKNALTTMDEPTEARKRISCLLIADAAVNSLSKADERPPNADAKSGEPQDGKQEKDVVLAHDDAAVFGDRLTPCGPSPLQHLQCHGIVLPRQRVVSSRQGATGRAAQPHRRSLVSFQFFLTPVMVFAVSKHALLVAVDRLPAYSTMSNSSVGRHGRGTHVEKQTSIRSAVLRLSIDRILLVLTSITSHIMDWLAEVPVRPM